jgi:hypothetical protein
MPAKKPPPQDEKPQRQRFEEAAREAQVDASGREFERAMKAIVPPSKPTKR